MTEALAKLSLAVILALKGTPFLYNGEEIGMRNYYGFSLEQFRDPESIRAYGLERRLLQKSEQEALEFAARHGRDKGRTPMQWDPSENAGFSPGGVQTWLPVAPDYREGVNVADQMKDQGSLWQFYRDLLHLRKGTPALVEGEYRPIELEGDVLGFLRQSDLQSVLVLLNFSQQAVQATGRADIRPTRRIFSSYQESAEKQFSEGIKLLPFEIWIGLVEG